MTPKGNFNLSNITLTIPNIGALKSITNYFNVTKYELTAQALSNFVSEIGSDCMISMAAYYAYYFYIQNKTLTYNTIFTNSYANLTDTQKDNIWNDPDYGWSK